MTGLFDTYNVLLAPMAGVSDAPFRMLCRAQGADLTFTEMVSAKGLSYANDKTRHLIELNPEESEIAVQIFGHEPDTMVSQAAWIEDELGASLAFIDINMGCPVRKMVSKGDGAALMRESDKASAIVRAVKQAVSHPVTCKFRRGYAQEDGESAPLFAKALEAAGADGLCVHGRYATQMYRGSSDWGTIARVKEAVSIPVVGNGDITTAESALAMIEETHCDAVMVARGAEGNPWIFAQIQAALRGEAVPDPPSAPERIAMARRHALLLWETKPRQMKRMRKHAMWYVAGLPGASCARGRFNYCSTYQDFCDVFDELLERLA